LTRGEQVFFKASDVLALIEHTANLSSQKSGGRRVIPFKYHKEASERNAQRRWSMHQLHDASQDAIVKASRGETGQLRAYLLSDAALDTEQREELAALIYRRIEHKEKGRPAGSMLSPRAAAKATWVSLVRYHERRWREAHPNKYLPRGMRNALINEIGDLLGNDGFLQGFAEITTSEIREALGRGKKKRKPKSEPASMSPLKSRQNPRCRDQLIFPS
jgi:hypothetical protein